MLLDGQVSIVTNKKHEKESVVKTKVKTVCALKRSRRRTAYGVPWLLALAGRLGALGPRGRAERGAAPAARRAAASSVWLSLGLAGLAVRWDARWVCALCAAVLFASPSRRVYGCAVSCLSSVCVCVCVRRFEVRVDTCVVNLHLRPCSVENDNSLQSASKGRHAHHCSPLQASIAASTEHERSS